MDLDKGDNPLAAINPPTEIPAIEPTATSSPTLLYETAPSRRPRPYIVRALKDYDSGRPHVLSFKKGTLIRVITELRSGWWDGRIEETNTRGWFPRTLVAKVEDPEDTECPTYVRARYPFQSNKPHCLSFKRGTLIRVFTKSGSGWWDGYIEGENSRRGWFPRTYVVKVSDYTAEEIPCPRLMLRTLEDYRSDKRRYLSFKKGALIRGAVKLRGNIWAGKLEGRGGRWGLFMGEMVARLDDEEQLEYMGEVDQELGDIDWLEMEAHEYFEAEQPTTEVEPLNEQTVHEGERADESVMEVDRQNTLMKEGAPAEMMSVDDDWDYCNVSDDECGGAPKAIPEAKLSGIGAVDANYNCPQYNPRLRTRSRPKVAAVRFNDAHRKE